VFVLQVHGSKHWTLRAPVVDAPLARHRSDHGVAAAQPVLLEARLAPGDSLYLPRGVVHSAAAQTEVSLHLTIGVLATTAHDVLRLIADRAADEVELRRALPPGHASSRDVAARVVKDVVADVVAWLGELDVDDVADDIVRRAERRRAPRLDGHLLDLTRLADIDDRTLVARREGTRCEIVGQADDGDRVAVVTTGRRVDLPAALAPALHRLLDGGVHVAADLREWLDGPSRLVLVRRLVREALLRVVDGS
jgi:hypothetical protein